jgi:hypothetical protein
MYLAGPLKPFSLPFPVGLKLSVGFGIKDMVSNPVRPTPSPIEPVNFDIPTDRLAETSIAKEP